VVSAHLTGLQLVEGSSPDDASLQGRFQFPIHAGLGAASCAVVYFEVPPGHHCGRHTHSAEEVLLILDGEVEAEVGPERVRLGPGGLVLIPAFAPHDVRNVGDVPYRAVGFFSSGAVVTRFEATIEPLGSRVFVIGGPTDAETA
jgi:quercetin dioxygenase-like cupin family protein